MADLTLGISDEAAPIHNEDANEAPASKAYVVICDALEYLGVSYANGDEVQMPQNVASTCMQLNQVREA